MLSGDLSPVWTRDTWPVGSVPTAVGPRPFPRTAGRRERSGDVVLRDPRPTDGDESEAPTVRHEELPAMREEPVERHGELLTLGQMTQNGDFEPDS